MILPESVGALCSMAQICTLLDSPGQCGKMAANHSAIGKYSMSKPPSKIVSVGKAGFKLSGKMGIGASAWGLSIAAIFVPVVSVFMIWASLVMAIIHAGVGGLLFPVLTLLTTVVNRWYFSVVPMGLISWGVTLLLMLGVIFALKMAIQSKFDA